MFLQEGLRGLGLQGGKANDAAFISTDDEPHQGIAQIADAVDEQNRFLSAFHGASHHSTVLSCTLVAIYKEPGQTSPIARFAVSSSCSLGSRRAQVLECHVIITLSQGVLNKGITFE